MFEALSDVPGVKRNYLVKRVSRSRFISAFFINFFRNVILGNRTGNVFFTMLLPDRSMLYSFNRFIARLSVALQSFPGFFSRSKVKWCYWPYHYRDLAFLRLNGLQVFDVDHNIVLDPNTDNMESMASALQTIGRESDLIISGVHSMISWYQSKGIDQVVRLRNGVDTSRFEEIVIKEKLDRSKPIVGYCGTLSKWIDQELFFNLVDANPQWTFVVIGKPYKHEGLEEIAYPNLVWLGEQTADITPQYLVQFDVALGLYQEGKPWLDVDSMKLYEYLAAGLPVVSTRFHGHLEEDFNDMLYLASDVKEFKSQIENILNWTSTDKESYRDLARVFVNQSTWNERAVEVINNIQRAPKTTS